MRLATLLCLVTALLMLPGAALAHLTHDECRLSQTIVDGPIHVDLYHDNCSGITTSIPGSWCLGTDVHAGNTHTLTLWETDCQTGTIIGGVTTTTIGGALAVLMLAP